MGACPSVRLIFLRRRSQGENVAYNLTPATAITYGPRSLPPYPHTRCQVKRKVQQPASEQHDDDVSKALSNQELKKNPEIDVGLGQPTSLEI